MESALLLWQACCLPSLLHGAGTWTEISVKTENRLNAIQRWFVKLIYQVGPGAPLASLYWDLALLDMGLLVWVEKVMLILHLRALGDGTLANKMYREQDFFRWPGLVAETRQICSNLQIEDCNTTKMCKPEYKKLVIKSCHKENEKRLRKQAEGKEKCDRIMKESYGKKAYIGQKTISEVRQCYRSRVGMQPFAGNYSHDKKYEKTGYLCKCQESRETESHLMTGKCLIYGDIREKYENFDSDEDLVKFFKEVLERRDELDQDDQDVE